MASELAARLNNQMSNSVPRARNAACPAGNLWLQTSSVTGKKFLSGNFGRSRISIHARDEVTSERQPEWYSYLAAQLPPDQRTSGKQAPSIPFNAFWESKVNGKTVLSTTITAATQTSVGSALEFVQVSDGSDNQIMFVGQFVTIPKKTGDNFTDSGAHSEMSQEQPSEDMPSQEAENQQPAMAEMTPF